MNRRAGIVAVAVAVGVCCADGVPAEPTPAPARAFTTASCARAQGLAVAPLAGEAGVYRAGPLTLVFGADLAQDPGAGAEAIAVLHGKRPVTLSVQSGTPVRAGLYFTAPRDPARPPTVANGWRKVRFPACGGAVHRFGGGIVFAGRGCARLLVRAAGRGAAVMLIPVTASPSGCYRSRRHARLYLRPGAVTIGVSCPGSRAMACRRLGVAVRMTSPAMLVSVRVAGRLVTLSPPAGADGGLWLGSVWAPALARQAPTETSVRVIALLAHERVATRVVRVPVCAGFG